LLNLEVGYRSPANGRVQDPAENTPSRKLQVGVPDVRRSSDAATADYKFAAAVVGYGLMLRDSPFKGDLTWEKVQILAEEGQGPDREGYRAEFLQLVRQARALQDGADQNGKAKQ
jgi:Ca-activated chloride channel family protein